MLTTTQEPIPMVLPIKPLQGDNGLTDEQVEKLLSLAGKYKDNPGYLERMMEGVREYRQMIQEELERELAEAEEAERSK